MPPIINVFEEGCDAVLTRLQENRNRPWQVVGAIDFSARDDPFRWGLHRTVKEWLRGLVDCAVQLNQGQPPVLNEDVDKVRSVSTATGLVQRLRTWAVGLQQPSGPPQARVEPKPPEPLPRLTVDLARKTITLDGTPYDVDSDNALRWVKVLADHPGEWISGQDLEKYDSGLINAKTNRLRHFLPDAILSLIDSETGKGSRIRL
jgi:hypothetical protein